MFFALRRPAGRPVGPTRSPGRRPRVVITTTVAALVLLSASRASAVAAAGAAARAAGPPTASPQAAGPQAAGPLANDAAVRGVWPLTPHVVVRGFSPPSTTYGAGHRGVDLAGTVGEAVRAALAGRVTYAGRLAGIGVVVVDHGATRTTYQPVRASVHAGASVAAGAVIGHLQLAGSHCLPDACLHWGWISGTTYLDPLGIVGGGHVRLLPLP